MFELIGQYLKYGQQPDPNFPQWVEMRKHAGEQKERNELGPLEQPVPRCEYEKQQRQGRQRCALSVRSSSGSSFIRRMQSFAQLSCAKRSVLRVPATLRVRCLSSDPENR